MRKPRTSGPSGAHKNPRRKISDEPEAFALQDAAASLAGLSWADWARAILTRAAARGAPGKRAKKEQKP